MKIKYVSDIHLEFSRFPVVETLKELDPKSDEILLVAGDTVVSTYLKEKRTDKDAQTIQWRFDEFLDAVSGFKAVYMIAGNHEAYHEGDVSSNKEIIQGYIDRKFTGSNVKFLENERVKLTDKTDLLACTLWTDMNKGNPETLWTVSRMMNDFYVCNYKGNPFKTSDCAALFAESKLFLTKELTDTSKNYVVMTHHCPSFTSIAPQYKGDPMNFGYASELDDFIMMHPHITHWVHGHTHYNVNYEIGHTKILGNMRGYPPGPGNYREDNWTGFKANKSFKVK